MKRFLVYICLAILSIFLIACSQENIEQTTTINETQATSVTQEESSNEQIETIAAGGFELSQRASVYKEMTFYYQDEECIARFYTTAMRDENGEMMWDDMNAFAGTVCIGENEYLLFPEQNVQIGEPQFAVLEDLDGTLHIILTDSRTAQYFVYDFAFDSEKQLFTKKQLMDFEGCNYWGSL